MDPATLMIMRLHSSLYVHSRGRIGHRMLGVPSLLLHTTGASSALPRTSCLAYASDGGDLLVVPSNFGGPKAPGWFHNLVAAGAAPDPSAEVQVGRRRMPVRSRVVSPGEPEFDRLWSIVNKNNHNTYRNYQAATSRPIPVVVLTPA